MHCLEVCLLCSLGLDFFALCVDFSLAVHLRHLFLKFLPICQVYEGGWTFVYIWLHLLPTYRDYKESWHWFVWEVFFTFKIWFMNLVTSRHDETLMEFKASSSFFWFGLISRYSDTFDLHSALREQADHPVGILGWWSCIYCILLHFLAYCQKFWLKNRRDWNSWDWKPDISVRA